MSYSVSQSTSLWSEGGPSSPAEIILVHIPCSTLGIKAVAAVECAFSGITNAPSAVNIRKLVVAIGLLGSDEPIKFWAKYLISLVGVQGFEPWTR